MWRSTSKPSVDSNGSLIEGDAGTRWQMLPIEHPNVDMSRVTNYFDPDTGNYIIRDAPKLNAKKANEELEKFGYFPFNTFAPVRVSQGSGRLSSCGAFL